MTRTIQTAHLSCPAELVWETVTSLSDWTWRSDIQDCRPTGTNTFTETSGGVTTEFTVTDKTPCRRYALAIKNSALQGSWEGLFASDGEGAVLTLTEEIQAEGLLRRLVAPAYLRVQQRRYIRDLTEYLRALSRHVVLIDSQTQTEEELIPLLRRAVAVALEAEKVETPCEVNVLLTDDAGIRQTNKEMREVDSATDVLSFPMFSLRPGEKPGRDSADPATGLTPLGDMCLSLQTARRQAQEYGHSLARETAYLAVHSVLHLLGYDHLDEGEQKQQMRRREESIMARLGLSR